MPNHKSKKTTSDQERFEVGGYWLSKRSDGRSKAWHRTWFHTETRQTCRASLGTTDFSEAKLKLAEWVLNNSIMIDEKPEDTPLSVILLRHWTEHGSKVRSAESIQLSLNEWNKFFGPITVAELTPAFIERFILQLEANGRTPGGVSRVLSDGRAALNRAKRLGELTNVPFVRDVPRGEPKERAVSISQLSLMFDLIKSEHIKMFCLMMTNTMARPEAILELHRDQLDFEHRLIRLNPEGRKQTKKYRPTVPMTDTVEPWLKRMKEDHVITYHGKTIKSVKKTFHRLKKEDGLPDDFSPYSIRHTMAKELRKRGVPPWELQGMLGHKAGGFRTTEIYAKYDPSYMSTARQAIDDIMKEVQEKCNTQIILNNQEIRETPKPLEDKGMVGDTRFELVTFSMSTRRSTPELIAPNYSFKLPLRATIVPLDLSTPQKSSTDPLHVNEALYP